MRDSWAHECSAHITFSLLLIKLKQIWGCERIMHLNKDQRIPGSNPGSVEHSVFSTLYHGAIGPYPSHSQRAIETGVKAAATGSYSVCIKPLFGIITWLVVLRTDTRLPSSEQDIWRNPITLLTHKNPANLKREVQSSHQSCWNFLYAENTMD